MKRLILLGLITILFFSGCVNQELKGGDAMTNTDDISYSDGIIAPMSAEELIQKLSKLNKNTTMADAIKIFGKEPRMVIEADSDIWEYFSGDITISLSGINSFDGILYQAILSYGDSGITIDLQTTDESK